MALINCHECGKQISDKATSCPNCGYPVLQKNNCILCGSLTTNEDNVCDKCKKDYEVPKTTGIADARPVQQTKKKKGNGCLLSIIAVVVVFLLIFLVPSPKENENENEGQEYKDEILLEDTQMSTDNLEPTKNVTVKEKKIYSKNNVRIDVKGFDNKEKTLSFFIKNNSNLNLGFNAHAYSVNGIMTMNNIYDMECNVATKKKANTELQIDTSFLDENNISEIEYIDILFWAYDNDKQFKEFETNVIRIKTSSYKKEELNTKGKKIYNNKGIEIKYSGEDEGKYLLSVNNKSGEYINFDVENITVNGYTSSDDDFDLFDVCLFDKNMVQISIKPENDFLKKNNIKKINTVEFSLAVRKKGDYFDTYNTDMIKVKVE